MILVDIQYTIINYFRSSIENFLDFLDPWFPPSYISWRTWKLFSAKKKRFSCGCFRWDLRVILVTSYRHNERWISGGIHEGMLKWIPVKYNVVSFFGFINMNFNIFGLFFTHIMLSYKGRYTLRTSQEICGGIYEKILEELMQENNYSICFKTFKSNLLKP